MDPRFLAALEIGYQVSRTNDRMLIAYDSLDLYIVFLITFGWTLPMDVES